MMSLHEVSAGDLHHLPSQAVATQTSLIPVTTPGIDDRFPAEVFDVVLDFVRIDDERRRTNKRNLFSCSRVSKTWHSLSLRHRFHSVSLFVKTGNSYEQRIRKNCFMQDLVQSPLFCIVQRFIQMLTLRWGIADQNPYIGTDLPSYFVHFPALRSLKLRGLLGQRIPALSAASGPILDSLSIEGWVCHARQHDPRVLCDVLRCFDSVGELWLEDLSQWLPVDDLELPSDERPLVSSLVLRESTCPHPVCDVLESAIAREVPMKRLDVRAQSIGDPGAGADLVKSFARRIEDFRCTISAPGGAVSAGDDTPPAFDFSQLPLLRTLTVAVEIPLSRTRARSFAAGEDVERQSPWTAATAALGTIRARPRSSALKLLSLQLAPSCQLGDKPQTAAAVMDALRRSDAAVRALEDALLGLVRERCVELVELGVYAAPPASGLRGACHHRCDDFVLGLFPRLRQTGVLRT